MIDNSMDIEKKEFVAICIRRVDPKLRHRFKVWCAKRERTMQGAIISLMQDALIEELLQTNRLDSDSSNVEYD